MIQWIVKITEKARKFNSAVLTFWFAFASFTAIFVINIAVFTFCFAHLLAGYKETRRYYLKKRNSRKLTIMLKIKLIYISSNYCAFNLRFLGTPPLELVMYSSPNTAKMQILCISLPIVHTPGKCRVKSVYR